MLVSAIWNSILQIKVVEVNRIFTTESTGRNNFSCSYAVPEGYTSVALQGWRLWEPTDSIRVNGVYMYSDAAGHGVTFSVESSAKTVSFRILAFIACMKL